jgi:calcium-translocating P-type ATPase
MDEKPHLWHVLPLQEVLAHFSTDPQQGLSVDDARIRREKNGKNILTEQHTDTLLDRVMRQFESPLVLVLALAGVVTLLLGEYVDATVIGIALAINVLIGTFQEERASRAFEKLSASQQRKATVLRGGARMQVAVEDIVPGDVVFLEGGYLVPADVRIVDATDLRLNEAALTGEWMGVAKAAEDTTEEAPLAERRNMAYMGTLVESGYGTAVVVETGDTTELGAIADSLGSIADEKTPLQKNIRRIAVFLTYIILTLLLVIFLFGVARGQSLHDMLFIAIAVAVSVMPSGLPPAVTVVLAVGMEALLKRGGLVRNLLAAETLGATTVVLTDKTGTLTEARMKLSGLYTYRGMERSIEYPEGDNRFLLDIAILQSDAYVDEGEGKEHTAQLVVHGRPIEKAVVQAGLEAGITQDMLRKSFQRIGYMQFSSERRFGASLYHVAGKAHNRLIVAGEPEKLLAAASFFYHDGKKLKMTEKERVYFADTLQQHAALGQRLIAVVYRDCRKQALHAEEGEELLAQTVFVGFVAFEDPVRSDVAAAIATVHSAHARIIMLTGDNPETARHIAASVGIIQSGDELVIRGGDIDALSDDALYEKLQLVRVIARAVPAHKLRIAQVLKAHGEVVAMTGDGINDAPALRAANIGVAVGSGTEVAKESSDLVLIENSFAVIAAAIEEGRRIIDNLKKIFAFLLSTSFSAIFLIFGALVTGSPLPLVPAQILWANIVSGDMMSFAFAFEKSERGVMRRNPRDSSAKNILTKELVYMVLLLSVVTGLLSLTLYYWLLSAGVPIEEIRTVMFVTLSLDALFFSFSLKSLVTPLWRIPLFSNRYLLVALAISMCMLGLALFSPWLQTLLSLVPLKPFEVGLLIGLGALNLIAIECMKWFFFGRFHKKEGDLAAKELPRG